MGTRVSCYLLLFLGGLSASVAEANERLTVHEWGTFTVLQDEQGKALPGINIDDEPVPGFVHNLRPFVLTTSLSTGSLPMKGAPQRHPYVTLRLETPVIYFYPPKGARLPLHADVNVALRGGWLTEFYPHAEADAPGIGEGRFDFGPITDETIGSLWWKDLAVGVAAEGPNTTQHVWNAPRQVRAATIRTSGGEAEKYLFYRGVGNFDAPLRVVSDPTAQTISIHGQFGGSLSRRGSVAVGPLWLLEARADGSCAFKTLAALAASSDSQEALATASTRFSESDFGLEKTHSLEASMQEALVAAGLFEDEAAALLSTWQRAYFRSPGVRLFYVVPREWTDRVLPLEVSPAADISRVMVGRIELISTQQRELLKQLRAADISDGQWMRRILPSVNATKFYAGRSDFGDLGVAIPHDYQLYLDLGRFRNALVLAENKRCPSPALRQFIEIHRLQAFDVPGEPAPGR